MWFATRVKQTRSRCCSRSGVSGLATAWYAARKRAKSPFSGQADVTARLPFISDDLAVAISQQGLEAALDQPLTRILEQVQLALDSAQEKPDVIYLTGGSARSPLIKKALSEQLPGIPVAGGDDFGSVTAGLARWAEVVFR
ncbi:putative chaperone [Salmonella enterica subsp. enterica serovar Newport str. WA_14881]|nr:putative chaperone [Salmonella enterica subsp. enterica serovar Newport str. WA_14881]